MSDSGHGISGFSAILINIAVIIFFPRPHTYMAGPFNLLGYRPSTFYH